MKLISLVQLELILPMIKFKVQLAKTQLIKRQFINKYTFN